MSTIHVIPPQARDSLMTIIEEQNQKPEALQATINERHMNVIPAREYIKDNITWCLRNMKSNLTIYIKDCHWPTLAVCQDLDLPQEIIQIIINPIQEELKANGEEKDEKDAMIQELRNIILELRKENLLWKEGKESSKQQTATLTEVSRQDKINQEEIRERRRRVRVPTFANGSVQKAKDWLAEYKSVCYYLHFSEQEQLDDLQVRFKGPALSWYMYLLPEIKRDWTKLEKAFIKYFAGGENTVEAALNELKHIKQGKTRMVVFAQQFREVARRAEMYSERQLIGYFKTAVNPEMTRAIIYRGPTTYSEAVNICIEVESDLLIQAENKTTYSPRYPELSTQEKEDKAMDIQNYQSKSNLRNPCEVRSIRCYKCNKKGHMKKDCRIKTGNQKRYQSQNNQDMQTSKREVNNENNYKEPDINIFSQFLQANNNAEIEDTSDLSNRRFMIRVQTTQGEEDVLIDTGSTMCSIAEEDAHRLDLPRYSCPAQVIRYGNSTIQTINEKAILEFTFENDIISTAHLYAVKNQNEHIILGMDWMIKEDIVLYPGKKSIGKIQASNNNAELVEQLLNDNPDLTMETETQSITTAPYKHRIDTRNALPCVTRDYRRSETENQAIQKEVEEMLKKKVIVPSTSDWCSPVVLIRKPDGRFRFCVDYRGLNKITVKDKYPLPRISELLDKLHGSYYFSTVDLKSGYWQLPLDEKDAKKTAFVANGSLYEFTCMPFGIVNGPSSFMRFMHIVLRGVPRTMVYLNDIIIYSPSAQQHEDDLKMVFKRLDLYNHKISAKKCQFFKREVKFLGFLVSGEGIRSDPDKVAVIKTWPTPTSVKQLMRFLGFCAFYHKFLKDLSSTARPLYKL